MQRAVIALLLVGALAAGLPATAATGRVIKVLPEFLDLKGRTSLSPSLYERDAYQAILRQHSERQSGLCFYVQCKTKGPVQEPLKIRLEVRGVAQGNLPSQLALEQPVHQRGRRFNHWTGITLSGPDYKKLGAVTAWRVTLWEGARPLGEQRSFLW